MSAQDSTQETFSKATFGFWIYLMTDCLLFGTLFATYAVLHVNTFGGLSPKDFSLSTAFLETILLLFSSVTCGLAMLSAAESRLRPAVIWLSITALLGAGFLAVELHEFAELIIAGNSWKESAFLSSFFALVATHGLHITIGISWLLVIVIQLLKSGITVATFRRLVLFSMFWHFLDLIWIFIFTFVYLMGRI